MKGWKYDSGQSQWDEQTCVDYEYDETGRRTKRKNNGTSDIVTTYAYNARSEAASITHDRNSTAWYEMVYTRDGAGNPLAVAFSGIYFLSPYTFGDSVEYEYDALSRLTEEKWVSSIFGTLNADTWAYDWVGNRDPSSWTYNDADMLTDTDGQQGVEYTYDKLGNLEYDPDSSATPRTRYHYNDDNLLAQVDDVTGGGTTSTEMTWDADAQRLKLERGDDTLGGYLGDALRPDGKRSRGAVGQELRGLVYDVYV